MNSRVLISLFIGLGQRSSLQDNPYQRPVGDGSRVADWTTQRADAERPAASPNLKDWLFARNCCCPHFRRSLYYCRWEDLETGRWRSSTMNTMRLLRLRGPGRLHVGPAPTPEILILQSSPLRSRPLRPSSTVLAISVGTGPLRFWLLPPSKRPGEGFRIFQSHVVLLDITIYF